MSKIQGSIWGIGVYVGVKNDKVTVISPVDGSPAEKAGLKSDDVIIAVNGPKSWFRCRKDNNTYRW